MYLLGYIKNWLEQSGQAKLVHDTLLKLSAIRNKQANNNLKKAYPTFLLPPDTLLYETSNLNFASYFLSGQEAAAEIHSFCTLFHPGPVQSILDWGCGTGRVTRHLPAYFPETSITGIDANPICIDWLQNNIPSINWVSGSYQIENNHLPGRYDVLIALSVLTHLPAADQPIWMKQLHSQIETNGLMWMSTHGAHYYHQLTPKQYQQLLEKGIITLGNPQGGSRGMRTYHTYEGMQQLIQKDWELILYYNGAKFPGILGGQDAWLLKKLG